MVFTLFNFESDTTFGTGALIEIDPFPINSDNFFDPNIPGRLLLFGTEHQILRVQLTKAISVISKVLQLPKGELQVLLIWEHRATQRYPFGSRSNFVKLRGEQTKFRFIA
jgi:hypothetical protein